jgi:hypothetical protein
LTGQKGDEKAAGLAALRLTALLRVGATNRLPDSRYAPLHRSAVRDAAPRKAREDEPAKKRGKQSGGTIHFSVLQRKSGRDKISTPRLRLGQGSGMAECIRPENAGPMIRAA